MEVRTAIVSGLMILGLLTIGYATLSWIFSVLNRFGMPSEAFVIVAGFLTIVFALVAARMFGKE
jgi:Kef-type K+ transport system membrane component KefB